MKPSRTGSKMKVINIPWENLLWLSKHSSITLHLGPITYTFHVSIKNWTARIAKYWEACKITLHLIFNRLFSLIKKKSIDIQLCTSHNFLVSSVFCCWGLVVVSSEFAVPHNTDRTVKYTNCAMPQKLRRATPLNASTWRLCGTNSFRNWFRAGVSTAFSDAWLFYCYGM